MTHRYLYHIFQSRYCWLTFALSFFLSYFLIPKTVFCCWYTSLAVLFMFSFALTITCTIRNAKEKIVLAKTYQSSLLGLLATAIGLIALQTCGLGAPVCGAAVGLGVLSSVFPTFFVTQMARYAIPLLLLSIFFQFASLYFMNCFRRWHSLPN